MKQLELFDQPSAMATRIANKMMVTNKDLILDHSKPAYIVSVDKRHGGPYDRGQADAYYGRPVRPHYYLEKTYISDRVDKDGMYPDQIADYLQGFDDQTASGIFKNYC